MVLQQSSALSSLLNRKTPELTEQFVRGLGNGRRIFECNCRTKYSSSLPETNMGPI